MEHPDRTGESLKEILLSSVSSTGFWSFIAAIVGVVAVAAGGIMFLTVEELRNFSVTVLVIGISLLFLSLVLSPRAVAIFLVGRQGRYGTNMVIITVAFFSIAVLVNYLMFLNPSRVDVTFTRVFTLAQQTTQKLDTLDKAVQANAFFVPTETSQKQRVEDLLNEFSRRTKNFSYRFIDPELEASLARQYNVTQYPTIVFEEEGSGTLHPTTTFTEQEFVTGILVVTGEERKKVYFLIDHKELSLTRDLATGLTQDDGLDFALQGMQRDNYEVRPLSLTNLGVVPPDAAVLVIAGPKQDLSPTDIEILTGYVMGGGRILALFDPETPQTFVDLLSQWGVRPGGHSIADVVSNVGGQAFTPLLQRANGQFLPGPAGARITDQLNVVFFPDVTSIETVLPPADFPSDIIGFGPLAMTTPASWLETNAAGVEDAKFDPEEDPSGPFLVAAIVEAKGTVDETIQHELAKFVVFGDSDFAKNRWFFDLDNADLFLNSVNWLAEDFDLISIRPKLFPSRRLIANRQEQDFIKWSSWFLPPSLMLFLGAFVWWRRR